MNLSIDVNIDGVKGTLDLFNDETIELNRSLKDITDLTKVFDDVTKSFFIPPTKKNNKFFKHWDNSDLVNGFNANTVYPATIRLGKNTFVSGKIRLDSIKKNNGVIESYEVSFFGNIGSLKAQLKDYALGALFPNPINFTTAQIVEAMTTAHSTSPGVFDPVTDISFPIIGATGQYSYLTGTTPGTGVLGDVSVTPIIANQLSPSVSVLTLFDRMKDIKPDGSSLLGTPIDIRTDDKFLSYMFGKLNVYFKRGDYTKAMAIGVPIYPPPFPSVFAQSKVVADTSTSPTAYAFKLNSTSTYKIKLGLSITTSSSRKYTVEVYNYGALKSSQEVTGNFSIDSYAEYEPNILAQGQWSFKISSLESQNAAENFVYKANITESQYYNVSGSSSFIYTFYGAASNGDITINYSSNPVSQLNFTPPNIKIADFLALLINTFNLIIDYHDKPDPKASVPEITAFTPYFNLRRADYHYFLGKKVDITKYVDAESVSYNRVKLYKNLSFTYKESKNILNDNFNNANSNKRGYDFGDVAAARTTSNEDTTYSLKIDAEVPMWERSRVGNTPNGFITTSLIDKDLKAYQPATMFIFDNGLQAVEAPGIKINGVGISTHNAYRKFSNELVWGDKLITTSFDDETSAWDSYRTTKGIFGLFHNTFIKSLYEEDNRIVKLTAVLPITKLLEINLNDTIMYAFKPYNINNMAIELTTRKVTFELIRKYYNFEDIGPYPFRASDLNTASPGCDATITRFIYADSTVIGIGTKIFVSENNYLLQSPSGFIRYVSGITVDGILHTDVNGVVDSVSTCIIDVIPPTLPTAFDAVQSGSNITITWSGASDNVAILGYEIQYKRTIDGEGAYIWLPFITSSVDYGNAIIPNLAEGYTYNVRLRVRDTTLNWSGFIDDVVTLADSIPPLPPTNLIVTQSGNNVVLNWNDAWDNIAIERYEVQYQLQYAPSWTSLPDVVTSATSGTTTITGLQQAQTWLFRVRTKDTSGLFSNYNTEEKTLVDNTPPNAPTFLILSQSGTTIEYTWGGATDNVEIFGYDIEYKESTSSTWIIDGTIMISNGGGTTFLYNLNQGRTYNVRLRTVDTVGLKSGYITSTLALNDTIPPQAPAGLTITRPSNAVLRATWTGASDNVSIQGYEVQYKKSTDVDWSSPSFIATAATGGSWDTPTLQVGLTYEFRVRTKDNANLFSGYNSDEYWLKDIQAPSAPANFTATKNGTLLDVAWNGVTDDVALAKYQVSYYKTGGRQYLAEVANTSGSGSVSISGLPNSDDIIVYIGYTDTSGNYSETSKSVSFRDTLPPTAPTVLTATQDDISVNLSWAGATDDTMIVGYEVEYKETSKSTWIDFGFQSTTLGAYNVRIEGFFQSHSYDFRVRTVDVNGNRSPYINQTLFMIDTHVPTTPAVNFAKSGGNSIVANWSGVTDNVGISAYEVQYKEDISPTWLPASPVVVTTTAGSGSYNFTGLASNKTYEARVRARDTANNFGDYGYDNEFLPDVTAPQGPTTFTAALSGGNDVILNWSGTTDDSGIKGYLISYRPQGGNTTTSVPFITSSAGNGTYTITGLPFGSTYEVMIVAQDVSNNYGTTLTRVVSIYDTIPPIAPPYFNAYQAYYNVVLEWSGATDDILIVGYEIDMKPNSSSTWISTGGLYTTSLGSGNRAITDLMQTIPYDFRIRTKDIGNNWSPYHVISFTMVDNVQPYNVSISTSTVSDGLVVSWSGGGDNVGVAGYEVAMSQDPPGDMWERGAFVPTSASSGSYTWHGVQVENTYRVRVRARDTSGNVGNYAEQSIYLPDVTPPSQPATMNLTKIDNSIRVDWTGITDNSAIYGYQFGYDTGTTVTYLPFYNSTQGSGSYTIPNLPYGASYNVRMSARDNAGNYNGYTSRNIPIFDLVPPTNPTTFTAQQASGLTKAFVSWSGASDNVAIKEYRVQGTPLPNNDFNWPMTQTIVTSSGSSSAFFEGLNYRTSYVFRIMTTDTGGNGTDFIQSNSITINDYTLPDSPTNMYFTVITNGFSVNWVGGFDNDAIAGYIVEYRQQGASSWNYTFVNTSSSNGSMTVHGLVLSLTYEVRITTQDVSGNLSSVPLLGSVFLPDTSAPTAPTAMSLSQSGTSINVSWSGASDDTGIAGYNLSWQIQDEGFVGSANINTSSTGGTYTINGLFYDETYIVYIQTRDITGNLSPQTSRGIYLIDNIPPTLPTLIVSTSTLQGRLEVSWSGASDNVGIGGYTLEHSVFGANTWVLDLNFDSNGTSGATSITGLANATSYDVRLRVRDTYGNWSTGYATDIGTTKAAVVAYQHIIGNATSSFPNLCGNNSFSARYSPSQVMANGITLFVDDGLTIPFASGGLYRLLSTPTPKSKMGTVSAQGVVGNLSTCP